LPAFVSGETGHSGLYSDGTLCPVFDLPKYGTGICLARLAALLDALSVDRARLRRTSVVVTGSNGKGSTAAFCARIGAAAGFRTGLFTSPHLIRVNERFQINGDQIADEERARLAARVEAAIADLSQRHRETYGAFEAMFALACLYFQRQDCDFTIFEAGIGGRYDPVRLVGSRLTCVTSLDLEHTGLLGDSLELIAFDKSDACAAGGTIVYGENCRQFRAQLTEYNRPRGVKSLFVRDDIRLANEVVSQGGQRFDFSFEDHDFRALEVSLPGSFQFNNAAVAVALFLRWLQHGERGQEAAAVETAIRTGLRETRWPGRLEVIAQDPLTVIDVGHTPDAIAKALASLTAIYGAEGWVLVAGVSRDKKADEIMAWLSPAFDTIVCTSACHKGTDAEVIAAAARSGRPSAAIHVAPTIEEAVRVSRALARSQGQKIFVAGGLFVAIEYATAAKGGRPQELAFF
jgi:dihydrofolate synthase / folylpolyglutamate synthase